MTSHALVDSDDDDFTLIQHPYPSMAFVHQTSQYPHFGFKFGQPIFTPQPYERSNYKLNIDLLGFNGNNNVEEFMDQLTSVDIFFDYTDILEEKKLS